MHVQGLNTLLPVFIWMTFGSLMLWLRILGVMVWVLLEIDPEARIQGQLVSKEGF